MSAGPVRRVLVVDDTEDLRFLLSAAIDRAPDLEVVGQAGDGQEAVALAGSLQPDVVLLDVAMPVMDGLQALPLIREAAPGVRVVMLSGFNETTMSPSAQRAGADAYLVKGGPIGELLETVRTL